MISREFDLITKEDIDALVTNEVAERRNIEYKQKLPGGTDEEKREFLADVSSFANAAGGDLIYGVFEKQDANNQSTGIPDKAEGLPNINSDVEIRRLDDMIRAGMAPRIPGYRIRSVEGFPGGPCLVVRIPKSWASPHMVIFKNLSRFFSRTSRGKYQLDVSEIRSAFISSSDFRTRISAFRADRLAKIIANETPINLSIGPKVILHLVPLTILDPTAQADLQPLDKDPNLASPIQNRSYGQRFNVDGFLGYSSDGYVQVFRSGAIEAVDGSLISEFGGRKLIPSVLLEETLIEATTKYLSTARTLGVVLPLIIMATASSVKDYAMATGSAWHNANPRNVIDRDTLVLPDILIESFDTPTDLFLKPIFDAFWQAAGFPVCEDYNAQGRWDGGRSKLGRAQR